MYIYIYNLALVNLFIFFMNFSNALLTQKKNVT